MQHHPLSPAPPDVHRLLSATAGRYETLAVRQAEEPTRRDLMRVMLQLTPHRPDLRAAFLAGYGRELTDGEWASCWAWAAIDCPAALRWAQQHREDPEITGYARTVLDLLRERTP